MGLFDPAWTRNDPSKVEKALKAVGKLNDPAKLAEVALKAPLVRVQMAAVERLADQGWLAEVARQVSDVDVQAAALAKVSDQGVLAYHARGTVEQMRGKDHLDASQRQFFAGVLEKVSDQGALEQVILSPRREDYACWSRREKPIYKRLNEAVDRVGDQAALGRIAKADIGHGIRLAAAKRLTDAVLAQQVFADIAISPDWERALSGGGGKPAKQDRSEVRWLRLQALALLSDQGLLAEVALQSADFEVRLSAAQKLTDPKLAQQAFAEIALNAHGEALRLSAIKKLSDQGLLAEVAQRTSSLEARLSAAERLSDEQLAQQVYLSVASASTADVGVCVSAVQKVLGQQALADIAVAAKHPLIQTVALSRITDQKVLYDIANNGGGSEFCKMATGGLTDQALLAELAQSAQHSEVRELASVLSDDSAKQEQEQRRYKNVLVKYYDSGIDTRDEAAKGLFKPEPITEVVESYLKDKEAGFGKIDLMAQLARNNPKAIAALWPRIRDWARNLHYDLYGALVNTSNDCGHADHIGYEDRLDSFPPYVKTGV
jgi:hypothetical protein